MAKKAKKTPLTTQTHKERIRQQQEEARKKAARIRRIVVGSAIALAVVVVATFVGVFIQQDQKNKLEASVTPKDANADATGIAVYPDKAKDGVPNVGVYFDYQSEDSVSMETEVGSSLYTLAESGDISLDLQPMLFYENVNETESSSRAAMAAACVDQVATNDIYLAYHQAVLANIPTSSDDTDGYSDEILLSVAPLAASMTDQQKADLQSCFEQKLTKGFVETAFEKSQAAGVTGVPTIRVNDKYYTTDTQFSEMLSDDLLTWIQAQAAAE
jgi:protein-disulfide isomerase